jgi:hypothetical protein
MVRRIVLQVDGVLRVASPVPVLVRAVLQAEPDEQGVAGDVDEAATFRFQVLEDWA